MYLGTLIPTKRSLLRFSFKLFDPLGFVSPFVVRKKILFQNLCSSKVEWDDNLDGVALRKWNCLPRDIRSLICIRVPRCLFNLKDNKVVSYQLHGFSDVSKKAFAAVVYLCVEYKCLPPDVQLVASKTRVAPVKKQSIPWLKLRTRCHYLSMINQ